MKSAKPLVVIALAVAIAWLVRSALRAEPSSSASVTPPVEHAEQVSTVHALAPQVDERAAERKDDSIPVATTDESTSSPEPVAEPDAAEPVSITLYGYLLPPEGRELQDSLGVSLVDRFGERELGHAGPDGAYALGGLAPGRYWLDAGSLDAGRAHLAVELEPAPTERRVDLQLALQPEIRVEALDREGEPLGMFGVLAVATLEPPGEWFPEVRGAFTNRFGVGSFYRNGKPGSALGSPGELGKLILEVEPPVFVSLLHYQRVIETKRVAAGEREVQFVVDRDSPVVQSAEVRFHFVDAGTGERIEAQLATLAGGGLRMMQVVDGEFRADGVAPGWYEVRALATGHEHGLRRLLVEPGSINDLGGIPLAPAVSIVGRVIDESGAGVATSLNYARLDEPSAIDVPDSAGPAVRSAADGSFEIGGLSRAVYFLSVDDRDAPWGRVGRRIDVRAGSVEDVRIELARGVALVLRPSSELGIGLRYRILDAAGELVSSGGLWSAAPDPILLAPGEYTIEARIGASDPSRHAVTLSNTPVELTLP